jgi:FAD-dependent urate hydroxylase
MPAERATKGVKVSESFPNSLPELEARLRRDLELICQPEANWVPPRQAPDGSQAADVVVIGAGMCGLCAEFALRRVGIRNVRILDRSPAGLEGPWASFARMRTLRSPKHLTGPAQELPGLTFRAWFEAQFGAGKWQELDKIPRLMWMDYLRWYRQVLASPVENGVRVTAIEPEAGLYRLSVEGAATGGTVHARRVVLATGRDGLGGPYIPEFARGLPRHVVAHSADDIDFAALRGKRVGVVGAGASAMDNAAEALEAGASELRLFVRRPALPRVNKLTGSGHSGFTLAFPDLDDEWRWRYLRYAMNEQVPPPRSSVQRVARHPQARLHLSTPVTGAEMRGDEVVVVTPRGRFTVDMLILGTGFGVDPGQRPEIAAHADHILRWRDRFVPPPGEEMDSLLDFPYLGTGFEFMERTPGSAPFLSGMHCFNYAATLSIGKVSGDIPAISTGARWLARGIASSLFREDREIHWEKLQRHDVPELLGDEWPDPRDDAPALQKTS